MNGGADLLLETTGLEDQDFMLGAKRGRCSKAGYSRCEIQENELE